MQISPPLALPAILAKGEGGGGGVPNPPTERGGRTAFMCFVAAARDIFHPQNRLKVHSAARWIPRKRAHRRLRYNVPNSSFRHLSFHVSPPFNPFGILLIYPKTPLTLFSACGNSVTQLSNVLRVTRRRTDRESLSRLQFPGWISAPLPPFRTLAPLTKPLTAIKRILTCPHFGIVNATFCSFKASSSDPERENVSMELTPKAPISVQDMLLYY